MTLKKDNQTNQKDFSVYSSLEQALRGVGGLQFEGSGGNLKVYLRGQASINYNTQPLFVVNGVPLGNSYQQANNALNVNNIKSISVISGMQATTRYGVQANHGAILIDLAGEK